MPKIRLARKQADKKEFEDYQAEEGRLDYNIWYHKYVGQRRDLSRKKRQNTKCVIARDAGWTKACKSSDAYFCLYFARGKCALGPDCTFLHRLPTSKDETRIPITRDCFGREKHATDREDMGGVGSFRRESKILYVGGLKNVPNLQSILIRAFKEWGEIDYVRLFKEKCYSFIKYKLRLCAEFAKEAMDAHVISGASFMLDIRWATEDPDDLATRRILETRKQAMIEKVEESGLSLKDESDNKTLAITQTPKAESRSDKAKKDSNKKKNRKSKTSNTMDAYSDYYKQVFPEMYEEMKAKMKAEMKAKKEQEKQEKIEKKKMEKTKKAAQMASKEDENDLSYENYMHKQLREMAQLNKRKRQEYEAREKKREEQLGSDSVDFYPDTSRNFKRVKTQDSSSDQES